MVGYRQVLNVKICSYELKCIHKTNLLLFVPFLVAQYLLRLMLVVMTLSTSCDSCVQYWRGGALCLQHWKHL